MHELFGVQAELQMGEYLLLLDNSMKTEILTKITLLVQFAKSS